MSAKNQETPADLMTVNEDAERSVVSALARFGAKDPAGAAALISKNAIDPDLFVVPDIRAAYVAVADLLADGIPPTAATIRALPHNKSALVELETVLSSNVSATSNLPVYVRILRRCALGRDIAQARNRLMQAVAGKHPLSEIRAIADSLEKLESGQQQRKTRLVPIEEFCRLPPSESWLIKNHLESDSLALIFGESGTYKSFLAIDICAHIATGKAWRGFRSRQGLAIYVAGEGANGLRSRFKAWFDYHHEPLRNVAVLTVQQSLCEPGGAESLIADIRAFLGENGRTDEPVLICLDTLATNFGAADENATRDMNAFISALRSIRIAFNACLLTVHHSGHSAKERGRGSSALHSGVDWVYRVDRVETDEPDDGNQNSNDYPDDDRKLTVLTCIKAKDSAAPPPLAFEVNPVKLPWLTDDGEPLSSCVLTATDIPATFQPTGKAKRKPITGKAKEALKILESLYEQRRKILTNGGHDPAKAVVLVSDWLAAMQSIEAYKQNRTRIIRTLEERKSVRVENGFVYMALSTR